MKNNYFTRFLILIFVIVIALSIGFSRIIYHHIVEECHKKLEQRAAVLEFLYDRQQLNQPEVLLLDKEVRITLLDMDGNPLLDNQASINVMENHNHREEVEMARKHGSCFLQRSSNTIGKESFYYAKVLKDNKILRLSYTRDMVWKDAWSYLWFLAPLLLVVASIEYLLLMEREKGERLRREFSANVSHELKTPLQSILGYSELMENNLVKEKDTPAFAEKIHKEAENLLHMIDDIIKISKLDEQELEMLEHFSLQGVCHRVVERLKQQAENKNITLQYTGAVDKNFFITGIPSLMEEIIYNLVDNGIKYNNPYGYVRLDISQEQGRYCLKIIDNGIGIPTEEQEKIFERFYRVDPSRQKSVSGTGLGLAMVKHGLKLHGGSIKLTSSPGVGSEFKVLLKPDQTK